jgi:uncharacterized protein (DUF1330 family)
MAGYVIAQIKVNDPEAYEEYKKQVGPTIEKFGGKFVIRGGEMEVLEGECPYPRVAVLEFPSVEVIREWYDSPEYAGPKAIRMATADTTFMIVEGI